MSGEAVHQRSIPIADECAMIRWGERLAGAMTPGMTLYLSGELGAGKTTFTRGIVRGLGHDGAVKSPTYTLVEPYLDLATPLYHFDLYRLGDPEELEFMGIRDYFDSAALLVVEWPQRGGAFLPDPDLDITIEVAGEGRQVQLTAKSDPGAACLIRLAANAAQDAPRGARGRNTREAEHGW